jgi:anaerobic magnesium-protoporphyrin IX monomethyl ester cyclase
MKVLLIFPWYPMENFFYRNSRLTPPLGIAYIASVLREHGHNVKVLDMVPSDIKYNNLDRCLVPDPPDLIGLIASTPTIKYANRCADIIRTVIPEAKIVFGGPHPTLLPEETLEQSPNVDYILRGECEYSFLQLVEILENGNVAEIETIKGIGIKKNNFVSNEISIINDLDSLPFPSFELFNINTYSELHDPDRKYLPMMSSRGCPYNCIFCNTPTIHGRKFRPRSPKNVVDEMELLIKKYSVEHILFYDDTFTFDMKRAEDICDEIIERGIRVSWRIRTRVDRVNQKLLYKLKNAGCSVISYGVETSSQKLLDTLRKNYTIEDVIKAFYITKKADIKILGYFVIGIPGETEKDVNKTIEFAKVLDPDYALFNILTPLPCSKSWELMQKYIITDNYSEYIKERNPVVSYPCLTHLDLTRLLDEAYCSFYLREEWLTSRIRKGNSIREIEADIGTFFFYLNKINRYKV